MHNFHHLPFLNRALPATLLTVILTISGCVQQRPTIDAATHKKDIEQWQAKRTKGISGENSWLTISGLYWLKTGENTFGSDSGNPIILPPGTIPKVAGSIRWKDTLLTLTARPGANVRHNDSLITSLRLRSDGDGNGEPTVITLGSVSFYVIKRGDQLGVRIKDKENAARRHFTGLDFFPINPQWRIEGKYEAYPIPKIIPITSVIGTVTNDTFPGAVTFTSNGTSYHLEATIERGTEPSLYFMFSDETGAKETYGLGRQLSTPMPDSTGMVVMDFNKSYNWPCAYTDFATCPIPPRENHLAIRVEAGEKKYPGHSDR
jgi:uncharacterized protein